MEKEELQLRRFKYAKFWNMASMVFKAIGVVGMALISLPSALHPAQSDYTKEYYGTAEMAKRAFEQASTLWAKAYSVVDFLVAVAILVMLFMAHNQLKEESTPSKIPYLLYFGWALVSVVYTMFATPVFAVLKDTAAAVIAWAALQLGIRLLRGIPMLITLVYVFKLSTKVDTAD